MFERSQKLFLPDILESINAITSFVDGCSFEFFYSNRKNFSATICELETIGEAIRNLSDEIKAQYPDVLWQEIRSFRNKIFHEYFGVDTQIVWDIVHNELKLLKQQITFIFESLA